MDNNMIHFVSSDGVECDICTDALDDMEMVEAIAASDAGSLDGTLRVVNMLFPDEEKKKVYGQIKPKFGGRVPLVYFSAFLTEVFDALRGGKK